MAVCGSYGWNPRYIRRGARPTVLLVAGLALLAGMWLSEYREHRPPAADRVAYLRAHTPPGMILIPAGWFWMGSNDPNADIGSQGRRRVWTPSYYIDRYPVTNAQYARYNPRFHFPPGEGNYPVTDIKWGPATEYLKSQGKALPTEAEWERAARGDDGRIYPWGNTAGTVLKSCSLRRAFKPVDAYPQPASPYGVRDMSGVVWQWVRDNVQNDSGRRIIRGGAAGYNARNDTTFARGLEDPGAT